MYYEIKRKIRKALESVEKIEGHEDGYYFNLRCFVFYIKNYSAQKNNEILKIAKKTHTSIEMHYLVVEDDQSITATFMLRG